MPKPCSPPISRPGPTYGTCPAAPMVRASTWSENSLTLMVPDRAEKEHGVTRGVIVGGPCEVLRVAVRFAAIPHHLDQVQRDELDEWIGYPMVSSTL
jgi:hypothetical protein